MKTRSRAARRVARLMMVAALAGGVAAATITTTAGAAVAPGSPSNLKAKPTKFGVNAKWTGPAFAPSYYRVEIRSVDGSQLLDDGFTGNLKRPKSKMEVPEAYRVPKGTYLLQVYAVGEDGTMSAPAWTYFTIKLKPPKVKRSKT